MSSTVRNNARTVWATGSEALGASDVVRASRAVDKWVADESEVIVRDLATGKVKVTGDNVDGIRTAEAVDDSQNNIWIWVSVDIVLGLESTEWILALLNHETLRFFTDINCKGIVCHD